MSTPATEAVAPRKSSKSTKAPKVEVVPPAAAPAEEPKAPRLTKLKFVTQTVRLDDLTFSTKIQARKGIDKDALNDYTNLAAEAKEKGADSPFPALKAVRRNGEILVFSGFTRGAALKKAGFVDTKVEVADSEDIEDSELFVLAVAANRENGSRANADDKLHNLHRILRFPEYAALPNTALAPLAGVSEFFVRKYRPKTDVKKVDKKGRKLSKRGTGRDATASKKAVAAAAANAENGAGGLDPELEGKKPSASKSVDAASRALTRIKTLLDGYNGFKGSEIVKAIEDGTIKVGAADLVAWAETSDARVKQIAPLVINLGWSPKKAFSHIDKEITPDTKVVHLINSAITTGGYTKDVVKIGDAANGENIVGNEPYKVMVWDSTKFEISVTPIKG